MADTTESSSRALRKSCSRERLVKQACVPSPPVHSWSNVFRKHNNGWDEGSKVKQGRAAWLGQGR